VDPGRRPGGDKAAGGVPLEVGALVVLAGLHLFEIVDIPELEHAVKVLEAREDDELALGRPVQAVDRLALEGFYAQMALEG